MMQDIKSCFLKNSIKLSEFHKLNTKGKQDHIYDPAGGYFYSF